MHCIASISARIESREPRLFVAKAVTAWAIPELRGVEGRRSTDMIVLPKAFYCMNAWDPDARPEQTRRRWRGGIGKRCEELVTQALRKAEAIIEEEGLLVHMAA